MEDDDTTLLRLSYSICGDCIRNIAMEACKGSEGLFLVAN